MVRTGKSDRRGNGRGLLTRFLWLPVILIFALGLSTASAPTAALWAGAPPTMAADLATDGIDPAGATHTKEQCQAHFTCSVLGNPQSGDTMPVVRDSRRPGLVQLPPAGLAPAPPDHPPSVIAHG